MLNYEVYIPGSDDVAHINAPWELQKDIVETKTGNSPDEIVDIDVPNDQTSIITVQIKVTGLDDADLYDSYFEEKLRVKKEDGVIESVDILEANDYPSINLQAPHGQISSVRAQSPTSADPIEVTVDDDVIHPRPLIDDSSTSDIIGRRSLIESLAQLLNNRDHIEAQVNYPPRARIRDAGFINGFDLSVPSPLNIVNEVKPDRAIERKVGTENIRYESNNPTAYGISKTAVPVNQRPLHPVVKSDGTKYLVYANRDQNGQIEIRKGPDFDSAEVIVPSSSTSFDGDGRYQLDVLVDDNDVLHVFWRNTTEVKHVYETNSGWAEEVVKTVGDYAIFDTVLDDDGTTIHILSSENVPPSSGQHGPLHHYQGTSGSWTDNGQIGSIQTKVPRVTKNDSGELGVICGKDDKTTQFNKYASGSWGNFEKISDAGGTHGWAFSEDTWYLFNDGSSQDGKVQYSYGTPGNWNIDNTFHDDGPDAWVDRVQVLPGSDGNVIVTFFEIEADVTYVSYGKKDDFDTRLIYDQLTSWIEGYRGPEGRAHFGYLDTFGANSYIISLGDPRTVDLKWKTIGEVKQVTD